MGMFIDTRNEDRIDVLEDLINKRRSRAPAVAPGLEPQTSREEVDFDDWFGEDKKEVLGRALDTLIGEEWPDKKLSGSMKSGANKPQITDPGSPTPGTIGIMGKALGGAATAMGLAHKVGSEAPSGSVRSKVMTATGKGLSNRGAGVAGLAGAAVSIAGDLLPNDTPSVVKKGVSAAGSALSGAATGAAIGSIVPGVGTAIGGAVGGLIGGISSLF